MARYSLVFEDKNNHEKIIIPLKNQVTKEANKKNELYEIDLITMQFSNLNDLLEALKKSNCIKSTMGDIYISYIHDKEERKLDIIYKDLLLNRCALLTYKKKNQGYKGNDLTLNVNTPGFSDYCNHLISIFMEDKNAYDNFKNSYYGDFRLKNCILDYINYSKLSVLEPEQITEKDYLKKQIMFILGKYKNLRGIKLWEKIYEKNKNHYKSISHVKKQQEIINNNKEIIFKEYIPEDEIYLSEEERENMYGEGNMPIRR